MKLIFQKKLETSILEKDLDTYREKCAQVIGSSNYDAYEASLCLPSDKRIVTEVMEMVKKKKTPNLKYVVVVGIGGSNLGAKAVYDALCGFSDSFFPDKYPKMIFLDTIDPKANNNFLDFARTNFQNPTDFVISIISKSGGTTESIVNAEIVLGDLLHKFPNWKERCVIITDAGSKLEKEGVNNGIDILEIPKRVGGRYSVFSAVGLFPLAMAGINIQSLLQGAKQMRDQCVSSAPENYAQSSSIFQFLHLKQGKAIHNSFFFHPELESLGKWYRQLMGESLGKEGKGITPIVSVGSVDHHSMVQLYWGGPQDKTTELIYSKKSSNCIVPKNALFPSLTTTQGKSTAEIMEAIEKGTAITYEKQNQPYFEVVWDEIDEREIGAYLQYKMMEIMYLANLLNINAFDQPQVELYKIETKKILG